MDEYWGIDVGAILRYWEYLYTEMQVNLCCTGQDQQLEIILNGGTIFFQLVGRPDGCRPRGYPSFWQYIKTKSKELCAGQPISLLSEDDVIQLQQEIILYNARSLAFLKIRDYAASHRDAVHNLTTAKEIIRTFKEEHVTNAFLLIKPHLILSYTRGLAQMSLALHHYEKAIQYAEQGLEQIRHAYQGLSLAAEQNLFEVRALSAWKQNVQQSIPCLVLKALQQKLEKAVRLEDYEHAAVLVHQIKTLSEDMLF